MTTGLLLVDVQNDYFPGGRMALVGMEEAAANARAALDAFRDGEHAVYHLRHVSTRPGATFFLPGTQGAEIHESVAPRGEEAVLEKHFPNGFRDTALLRRLRDDGIDELVICGAMSHMCIDATTRAAFDHGFSCTVVEDACATRDLDYHGRRLPAAQVHASFMAALSAPFATLVESGELVKRIRSQGRVS